MSRTPSPSRTPAPYTEVRLNSLLLHLHGYEVLLPMFRAPQTKPLDHRRELWAQDFEEDRAEYSRELLEATCGKAAIELGRERKIVALTVNTEGVPLMRRLIASHRRLPPTVTLRLPDNSWQLWFRVSSEGTPLGAAIANGIALLGDGSVAFVPGSKMSNGTVRALGDFDEEEPELAALPQWVEKIAEGARERAPYAQANDDPFDPFDPFGMARHHRDQAEGAASKRADDDDDDEREEDDDDDDDEGEEDEEDEKDGDEADWLDFNE